MSDERDSGCDDGNVVTRARTATHTQLTASAERVGSIALARVFPRYYSVQVDVGELCSRKRWLWPCLAYTSMLGSVTHPGRLISCFLAEFNCCVRLRSRAKVTNSTRGSGRWYSYGNFDHSA